MKKHCVFVESSCVGAAHSAQAARNLGYEPLFLTDRGFSQGDTRAQIESYAFRECKTNSVSAMVDALRSVEQVVAVTSFADLCLMNASGLARALGVRGLDPVVGRLKDKLEVCELVAEFSPPTLSFEAQDIPLAALETMLSRGPVMVKGRCSSGGQGSTVLRNAQDLMELPRRIELSDIPSHLSPDLFMAQQFITGTLVSLEGFVSAGAVTFLGFSGRVKVGNSESRIQFPYDDELPQIACDKARRAVTALVQRSQLARGYFHIEFMLTEDMAYVIDANVGRIGGGGLGQQIALAFGIAPEEVHGHALALSIGDPCAAPAAYARGPQRSTISLMYGIAQAAEFRGLRLPEPAPGYHTCIADAPQRVPAMGLDNYGWIAIASGETNTMERWLDQVKVVTDIGEMSPVF